MVRLAWSPPRGKERGLSDGLIPCKKSPMDDSHHYRSAGSGSRFRPRCIVCRHSMNEYRSRAYFAKLIRHGLLSREAVQLPSPPSPAQQDQAQAPGIIDPGRSVAGAWTSIYHECLSPTASSLVKRIIEGFKRLPSSRVVHISPARQYGTFPCGRFRTGGGEGIQPRGYRGCMRLTIRPRDSADYTDWTALAMT
ncbi:hypothetical protein J005_02540 [Cryptococcus neoformans]|nr:hypothetical protein C344_02460 [Cryptococcus neoformans var. grubii AD1-7a]OXH34405.1 hypothetical protein J005_02540 [Cryptococcus neoformans var. grubii]